MPSLFDLLVISMSQIYFVLTIFFAIILFLSGFQNSISMATEITTIELSEAKKSTTHYDIIFDSLNPIPFSKSAPNKKKRLGIGGYYGKIDSEESSMAPLPNQQKWRTNAVPLALIPPVRCKIGRSCFITEYVDVTSNGLAHDYRCGPLSKNGAEETIFTATHQTHTKNNLDATASAGGRVQAVRAHISDTKNTVTIQKEKEGDAKSRRSKRRRDLLTQAENIKTDPGNYIILEHNDGWRTEYRYLQQNSITLRPGDTVKAGQIIGKFGQTGGFHTGGAYFPRLGFKVTLDGKTVAPFIGLTQNPICKADAQPLRKVKTDQALWHTSYHSDLTYIPVGILGMDIIDTAQGFPSNSVIRVHSSQFKESTLIFWTSAFGVQVGDRILLELFHPHGALIGETRSVYLRRRGIIVNFLSVAPQQQKWQSGSYRGLFKMFRVNGNNRMRMYPILSQEESVSIY